MTFRALGALTVAAATLVACGPAPEWTREGATGEATAADLTDCRTAARQESWRYPGPTIGVPYWGVFWGPRYYGWGPRYFGWSAVVATDRSWEESRLTDFCMRSRGYKLEAPTQG